MSKPLTPEQVARKGSLAQEKKPRGRKKNYNTRAQKSANLLAAEKRVEEKYTRTDEQLKAMAKRLITFAQDPTTILFTEFYEREQISQAVFAGYEARCPELKEAHKYAMLCVGNHREKGGLLKKLDVNMVKWNQYQYSPDWKAADKYQSDLKANADKNSNEGTKYIVLPAVESTDVPPAKK